jgi:hypothetical protein
MQLLPHWLWVILMLIELLIAICGHLFAADSLGWSSSAVLGQQDCPDCIAALLKPLHWPYKSRLLRILCLSYVLTTR